MTTLRGQLEADKEAKEALATKVAQLEEFVNLDLLLMLADRTRRTIRQAQDKYTELDRQRTALVAKVEELGAALVEKSASIEALEAALTGTTTERDEAISILGRVSTESYATIVELQASEQSQSAAVESLQQKLASQET